MKTTERLLLMTEPKKDMRRWQTVLVDAHEYLLNRKLG